MNIPVVPFIDEMLVLLGSSSLGLAGASIGLIAQPFTSSDSLTMAGITECNFNGYARQSIGNPTVPFTGADGNEYVQGNTLIFQPTGSTTPNTAYGLFFTNGSTSGTLQGSDAFDSPIPLASPANRITITPRFGINPKTGLGFNVVSD